MTVAIPAMLLCLEMVLFSGAFHFVYTYRPYVLGKSGSRVYHGGPLGVKAFWKAFNPVSVVSDALSVR